MTHHSVFVSYNHEDRKMVSRGKVDEAVSYFDKSIINYAIDYGSSTVPAITDSCFTELVTQIPHDPDLDHATA